VHSQSKLRQATRLTLLLLAVSTAGCQMFLSTVGLMSGGNMADAAYDGLEGQRVAIVCLSDSSSYGSGTESSLLASSVATLLAENVAEIEVVSASEVADWVDRKGWDQIDYRQVGQGVKADRVVAIDVEGFRLHQDPTLYKGEASLTVTVFDMQNPRNHVFRRSLPELSYPRTGVVHASDVSESKFRRQFIKILSEQVARYFYKYDALARSALDGAFVLE